jgi:hypothetical protein
MTARSFCNKISFLVSLLIIRQNKHLLVITIPFSGLLTQNFDTFYYRWMGQKQTSYVLATPAIDPLLSDPILPDSALLIIVVPVQAGMTKNYFT